MSIPLKNSTASQTVVASSVFMDLVGFSKLSTTAQVVVKNRFNATLKQALAELGNTNYWVRDLGDGALIICPNSPEHALFIALGVLQVILDPSTIQGPALELRIGLNLGVLKSNVDLEGRANYLGDGINATQRVMDFAQPGQILASRSFVDAVAYLHVDYATLFRAPESKEDKHGRVHEVYALIPSEITLSRLREDVALNDTQAAHLTTSQPASPGPGGTQITVPVVGLTEHIVTIIRNWFIPINALFFTTGVVWAGFQRFGLSGSRAQWVGAGVIAIGLALWLTTRRMSGRLQLGASRERTASAIAFLLFAIGSMVTITAWVSLYLQESAQGSPAPTLVAKPLEAPKSAVLPSSVMQAPKMPIPTGAATLSPSPTSQVPSAKPASPVAKPSSTVAPPKSRLPASVDPVKSFSSPSATDRARCTALLNKSALGEFISNAEKQEISQSCR